MLVLTRKQDERIFVGDDIEIMVIETREDRVRLGIKAPPGVPVHREEIYERIRRARERDSQ